MAKTPEIDLRDSLVDQNKIINGNFDFWQRGVGPTTSGNYLADRFICAEYLGTGVANMQQSSDVPSYEESKFKSSYSLQMTVTTAQTSITGVESAGFFYKMEGTDFRSLYSKTFTLSFWIKSSVTGTFGVAFRNSGFTRTLVKEVTINAANTWEKKSVTVTHDTTGAWNLDTSMGIDIAWSFSCGATYKGGTDGVWNNTQYLYTPNCNMNIFSTLGNSVKIAQVMLNEGTEALPFSLAGGSYANELQLCQRYFEKSYNLSDPPGANTANGRIGFFPNAGTSFITGNSRMTTTFQISKRGTTVVKLYTTNGTIDKVGDAAGIARSAFIDNYGQHGFEITYSDATSVSGIWFHFTADAEL